MRNKKSWWWKIILLAVLISAGADTLLTLLVKNNVQLLPGRSLLISYFMIVTWVTIRTFSNNRAAEKQISTLRSVMRFVITLVALFFIFIFLANLWNLFFYEAFVN
jgi:hypothetical protein